MTPERLQRIRALYEAAVKLEAADVVAFLEQECRGDLEMADEVTRLLNARRNLPDWFSAPLLGPSGRAFDLVMNPALPEGTQLGAYKLIREIGHGGMGSVYLAERADGAFRKQVAVKVVRPGKNNAAILERFRHERDILASLDHPNIARLIDGGSTEEGLPYFVMEFVDGQPIHRWADARKLNISRRLQLFRQVCDAVQYAHQRLVVHRDLKPGNILVTPEGVVKLLDFGIAKVLDQHPMGDLSETATIGWLMTPEYASPEQVKGQALTTLTDVYSLGVVLYELLTGHRPYQVMKAALEEMVRVIAEVEPARPSHVVTTREEAPGGENQPNPTTPESVSEVRESDPRRLSKRLKGDLDCILLMALHKEPSRRYRSIESFSNDVQRHLESRPVMAREDSLWYRAGRFVGRHPAGVAAGAMIAVSLEVALLTGAREMQVALEAGGRRSPTAVLGPQLVMWACLGMPGFCCLALMLRASLRRAAAALAGGIMFAATWFVRLRIDYAMGWWKSRFADTPDLPFPPSLMFLIMVCAGAILILVSWWVARRFGGAGVVLWIGALSVVLAFRDRIWWQNILGMMILSHGTAAMLADIALLALGLLLGYGVMRVIAGPTGAATQS